MQTVTAAYIIRMTIFLVPSLYGLAGGYDAASRPLRGRIDARMLPHRRCQPLKDRKPPMTKPDKESRQLLRRHFCSAPMFHVKQFLQKDYPPARLRAQDTIARTQRRLSHYGCQQVSKQIHEYPELSPARHRYEARGCFIRPVAGDTAQPLPYPNNGRFSFKLCKPSLPKSRQDCRQPKAINAARREQQNRRSLAVIEKMRDCCPAQDNVERSD
jgi:hypothetical protein